MPADPIICGFIVCVYTSGLVFVHTKMVTVSLVRAAEVRVRPIDPVLPPLKKKRTKKEEKHRNVK